MSTFKVETVNINSIEPIPNADRLELAVIGGYRSVVPKDAYQVGDVVIYVPEGAIMPEWVLERENLVGKLAGSTRNRVKAIKLRGCLSQGIVLDLMRYQHELGESFDTTGITWRHEGLDVTAALGITKWEPPIPVAMAGEVMFLGGVPLKYDIENLKRYPDVLGADDEVVLTEKLHGTFCQIGWKRSLEPNDELFGDGRVYVCSKGLGGQGLVFKNNGVNKNNLYVRVMRDAGLIEALAVLGQSCDAEQIIVMGEVFGDVQDLKYGLGQGRVAFRIFDLAHVIDGELTFCDAVEIAQSVAEFNTMYGTSLMTVPHIARGKLRDLDIAALTRGKSTLAPNQIREGVVIKPVRERTDPTLGRVILKSVSEDYLLRRNPDASELS